MAGGIKGITVKIGGDTTELGRALSDATTKSTALQKELKGVNTLLKMDPGNVTLLKQKADLLKGSIEETKNKLNSLKEILAKADTGEIQLTEEEYRNLQREIVSTEQKLKGLKDQSFEFGSVGAQKIALVGEELQKVGGKVEAVGEKFSVLSGVTGAVLTGSIAMASNYEDAMAKVNTIADTSSVSLEDLSAQILDLSNQTGVSAEEIADATYNAISAGQDTADAVNFVSNATSLARAGFTDTASSIDILTTIMNAYGLEASEVDKVCNNLITTQNLGKTTVAELSSSMGKIIPTAKATGVNLDELCGAYAVMTANGIATAETTTYMNSMLNELGKQGTTASKAFAEGTEHIKEGGLTMAEAMEMGWSLTDVLSILDEQAYESGTTIGNMFGSAEAGKSATVLWDNANKLNDAVESMGESAGATQTALEKLETPSQKAKVAMTQLKNSGIQLGQTALASLTPLIDKVCNGIQKLTEWFTGLSPEIQRIILAVLAVITALGPAIIILGKLLTAIGTIMTWVPKIVSGFKLVGTAFKSLGAIISANPIILVIGALIAILIYAYTHSEKFRESVTNAFEKIKEVAGVVLEAISGFFAVAWETIKAIWDQVQPYFEALWETIKLVFSVVADVLSQYFAMAWDLIKIYWDVVTSYFQAIWDTIAGIFSAVEAVLSGDFAGAWEAIKGIFATWGSFFSGLWENVKKAFSSVKTFFVSVFGDAWEGIKNIFSNVGTFFGGIWTKIKDKFTKIGTAIGNAISNSVKAGINGVINSIEKIINKGIGLINGAIDLINKIPGVTVGKLEDLSLPRLARGGVVNRPTVAEIGENGPEAVVPLKNNTEWIDNVADRLSSRSRRNADGANKIVDRLDKLEKTISTLKIVLDSGELVGGIIDNVDTALSNKSEQVVRGW